MFMHLFCRSASNLYQHLFDLTIFQREKVVVSAVFFNVLNSFGEFLLNDCRQRIFQDSLNVVGYSFAVLTVPVNGSPLSSFETVSLHDLMVLIKKNVINTADAVCFRKCDNQLKAVISQRFSEEASDEVVKRLNLRAVDFSEECEHFDLQNYSGQPLRSFFIFVKTNEI